MALIDAETGALIWGYNQSTTHIHNSGLVSDIDPTNDGMECYSKEADYDDSYLHAADGTLIADDSTINWGTSPWAVYWDADLYREVLKGQNIWDYETSFTHSSNIQGNQRIWADILGDWREEIITSVDGEIRIYTTTIPATDRHVCLMQDPIYRNDVAHLSMGYQQCPMMSYCLSA